MTAVLTLDPILDLKAATPLKAALAEHRGQSLQLDASGVQRLGGLCLQVLVAARQAWRDEGRELTIEPRSDSFSAALTLFAAAGRFEANAGSPGDLA